MRTILVMLIIVLFHPSNFQSGLALLGGSNLFLPNSRKSRSDGLADWIRTAVVKWWTDQTRITACAKNVVVRDGLEYPVHWLEDTIERFYEQFLESNPHHYYTNQLLVRGHGCEGVSRSQMLAAFKIETLPLKLRTRLVSRSRVGRAPIPNAPNEQLSASPSSPNFGLSL